MAEDNGIALKSIIALSPGSIYCTLTNNSNRGKDGYPGIDVANLCANNLFGHIIEEAYFKLLLTGLNGAEVTGIAFTSDNKTMFINIQHPGESADGNSDHGNPNQFSSWPDHNLKGRPRAATVVIQRTDNGVIGL